MDPTGTALAVTLCVASAFAYALGAVVQQRLADRPTRTLVRTPLWWGAIGLNGLGAVLHVVALPYGPLVLVQSFGVLTLALAVPMGAVAQRRRITGTESVATTLVVAGLLGLLLSTGSGHGAVALSGGQLSGLLSVTAAALILLGYRGRAAGASGLWSAVAGGTAFGVSSAVSQTVAVHVTTDGLDALLRLDVLAAVVAIAALATAGVFFTQRSYRSGLGAPLAISNIANPVSAAAIGVVLLGERLGTDVNSVLLALVAALAAVIGVHLLSVASAGSGAASPSYREEPNRRYDDTSAGVLVGVPVTMHVR
ncbi:DMT family transporter [Saccharothrix deserti]|uniref:DMT family transporter n=1 Tax=Saccharothrix deserti TaxID=2593674 RepID=UPI00131CEB87|nr:DMT family transporter [Saccharothrix deserti]